MSADPSELGTLVVVVGKARNLPNLARFGKQDPFCAISVGSEKKKTPPIKRGGQHPEWDEELRFSIMQDVDDILAASAADAAANSLRRKPDTLPPLPTDEPGVVTPATMASKTRVAKGTKGAKKAGKTMRIACYADDPKEPELIGEAVVPIDEVLKKGEIDEWYELTSKDKYAGEVYLELTFFSNAKPPVKRNVPRPAVYNPNAPVRPQKQSTTTGMDLYIPPYGKPVAGQGRPPVRPTTVAPGQGNTLSTPPAKITHSASFTELGLPSQPMPGGSSMVGQPDYPPSTLGRPGGVPVQPTGIDSLSRPMASMSLGPSHHQRPPGLVRNETAPPTTTQFPVNHYGTVSHNHRHSLDAHGPAPWAALQESQPLAGQRPTSAIDQGTYGMQQDPRVNGTHSVSPSPMGSQSNVPPAPHHHRTNSTTLAPPQQGGYSGPSGYGAVPPPRPPTAEPPQPYPPHNHSPHSSISGPAPYPPSQSQQAPYTPPANRRHSFNPSYQTPPQPTPPQASYPQQQPPYGTSPTSQPSYPPQQQQYGSDYPPVPPPPQKQHSSGYNPSAYDALPQRTDSFSSNPPVPGGYPSQPYPPSHSPTPQQQRLSPQPPQPPSPPKTTTGAYVPWYMQTQQNAQRPQSPPANNYGTPPHPPAPQARPNVPTRVGYYPSDELYMQQNAQGGAPSVPPPASGGYPQQNQQQPSPPHTYNQPPPQQQQPDSYPLQQQPYPPQTPYPPQQPAQSYPPANSQPPYSSSGGGYDNNAYASTPPAPPRPQSSSDAPWAGLQQLSYSNSPTLSHTLYYAAQDVRSHTAAPPNGNGDFRPGTAAPDWNPSGPAPPPRLPSPMGPGGPGNRDWRNYLSSLSGTEHGGAGVVGNMGTPSQPPVPPPRIPSPNPPLQPYAAGSNNNTPTRPPQQDWYNTPPPPPPVPTAILTEYAHQQYQQAPPQPQWR